MKGLLVIFTMMCACAPLDRRSPFASAAYKKAIDRTKSAISQRITSQGPFLAGWARVPIEVPSNRPLAGFGQRKGALSTGTSDPCFVRSFAISVGEQRVLILTADLLAIDVSVSSSVRQALSKRLDPDSIIFSASHTHSGPGAYVAGLYQIAFGPYDKNSFNAVVDALIKAGTQALSNLKPARIGHARLVVPGLITNRVEKGGSTDNIVFLLYFEQLETEQKAALWSFAAHPVTKTYKNLKLSADYPGTIAREFENQHLDLLAFVAGGVGSMNPRIEGGDDAWISKPLTATIRKLLDLAKAKSLNRGRLSFTAAEIEFPPLRYRISKNLMLLPLLSRAFISRPPLIIQALAINDSTILTLPGEISGQLTKPLRTKSDSNLSIWSLNGNYIGYVVPRRVYNLEPSNGEKLFEYETQLMSFLGPWGADYLLNVGMRLVKAVQTRP